MTWIAGILGTKAGKIGAGVLGVLLLGVLIFALGRCTGGNDDVAAQVEQTNRSGEAAADAAEMAIDTLEDRTVTDAAIDAAVTKATQEIENAETVDAVRSAVIDSLCGQTAHRNDPACRVQPTNP